MNSRVAQEEEVWIWRKQQKCYHKVKENYNPIFQDKKLNEAIADRKKKKAHKSEL